MFVWQGSDLVFNSEFEKIALKQQHKNSPLAPLPLTHIKIQHTKGSINGSQGKGTHIFYKTIKLV